MALGAIRGSARLTSLATLARALLREDASFHAYQMLEAGMRQFNEWGNSNEGRHILIAVARYLAAPTHPPSAPRCRRPTSPDVSCAAASFIRKPLGDLAVVNAPSTAPHPPSAIRRAEAVQLC